MQSYEKYMTFANENAKNVRKICEKVRILSENAIKDGSLPQKGGRKETYKNSRLCDREFLCCIYR